MVKVLLVSSDLDEIEIELNKDELELILKHKINFSLVDGDYRLTDIEYSVVHKKFRLWATEAKL